MATSKQNGSDVMERRAVNSSGRLGSPYDGFRDHIIEQCSISVPSQWSSLSESPKCELINGDTDASNNILQWMNIQDELRLSLLLQLIKRSGIAEVLVYPYCINQYTRFLYYSWISGKDELIEKKAQTQIITEKWKREIIATHMITSITLGIDAVVVLQLPSEADVIKEIDRILKTIRDTLREKNSILKLNSDENNLLERIINTRVYSNISRLTSLTKVSDFFNTIGLIKMGYYRHYPLSYTLQLITTLYPPNKRTTAKLSNPLLMKKADTFRRLSSSLTNNIEQYLLQFRNPIKYTDASLNENVPKLLCGHLQHRLRTTYIQWLEIKDGYMNEMHRFSKLVVDARSSEPTDIQKITQGLQHDNETCALKNSIDEMIRYVIDLETKGHLINDLRQQRFEYWNAAEYQFDKSKDIRNIERSLISNDRRNRVLCSSDTLNKTNESKLVELCRILVKKYKENSELRLIYLDFSYSSFSLQNMIVLPSDDKYQDKTHSIQQATLPIDVPQSSFQPPSPPLTGAITNILLLGETGVGKSTFINAFANYLTFNSLEQAQSNEPIVIIPVSFTMTSGDNFEEHTIKFGEFDSSDNENFNNVGQSVTQHCKSYVFDLHQFDGKKLRIIDTPGFGDTRGLDQDDRNMEHILQYINNLTHLNAICFLLKPNSSRLNIFFRTCLIQLFSFLNPDARKNVIFCFTNGRSTFYTPGDTAPLLKTMLSSDSINDIPFKKENTFCFDSESFRYLVALQNEVPFTEEDKHEYETSWSISVKESNRLIDHIHRNIRSYHIGSGWQSIKHAQFEISYMIRPILETMRNILRNLILCEKKLSNQFVELHPTSVHRTATRCRSCRSKPDQVGKFWIISDISHELQTGCLICPCAPDRHVPVDYMLEYELSQNFSKFDQNEMNAVLKSLYQACAKFAHFLMHIAHSTKDDPFLMGLKEMIDEESYICENQKPAHFNMQLVEELTKLTNLYEQNSNKLKPDQESMGLPAIYKLIKVIAEYPVVQEQMIAVKQTQKKMMEEYDYETQKI